MDVLVVRHALAMDRDEAKAAGMLDRDRPLTKKGRTRMKRAARGLGKLIPSVSAVITSPLRRAVETADVLRSQYEDVRQVEIEALLPDREPGELAQFLADGAFESPVLVIGHEPHLSRWVSWGLAGEPLVLLELRKGGACLLRFEGDPGSRAGRLLWLLTPTMLRRL